MSNVLTVGVVGGAALLLSDETSEKEKDEA